MRDAVDAIEKSAETVIGKTFCRELEPLSGYSCTRIPGHDNDHVAGISKKICARWANEKAVESWNPSVETGRSPAPLPLPPPHQIARAPRTPTTVTPLSRCSDCGVPLSALPSQHKSFCRRKFDPAPETLRAEARKVERVDTRVRIVRVVEYYGEREQVEKQIKHSIHGQMQHGAVEITAATLGDVWPEGAIRQVLDEARKHKVKR